jgi:hypothetical protein
MGRVVVLGRSGQLGNASPHSAHVTGPSSGCVAGGASSRASSPSVASLAGGSVSWLLRPRRLLAGFGAGVMVEPDSASWSFAGLVPSLPSPSDQNAQPLHAFTVIAVPAADGLLNSRPSLRRKSVLPSCSTTSAWWVAPLYRA